MDQHEIYPGAGDQFGLNDTTQSFFFSPKQPLGGWLIWGAGPVVYLPTGTVKLLSAEKWGVGPTAVALTQSGPWTVGIQTRTGRTSIPPSCNLLCHTRPKMPGHLASTRGRLTIGRQRNGQSRSTRRLRSYLRSEISQSAWVLVFGIGQTVLTAERTAGGFVGRRRFSSRQVAERACIGSGMGHTIEGILVLIAIICLIVYFR